MKKKVSETKYIRPHNQGVPGSCPGGPTWKSSSYERKFVAAFFISTKFWPGFVFFDRKEGMEIRQENSKMDSLKVSEE